MRNILAPIFMANVRIRICLVLAFAALIVFPAWAEERPICVVPVLAANGEQPRNGTVGDVRSFEGSKFPVFYDVGYRRAEWRLDEKGILVEVGGGFPDVAEYDQFAVDSSGRVVGKTRASGLFVQGPADGQFRPLRIDGLDKAGVVAGLAWVERLSGVLLAAENGLFVMRGDAITPLETPDWKGAGGEVRLTELPAHKAVALATDDKRLFILAGDNSVHEFKDLDPGTEELIGEIRETGVPGRLLAAVGDRILLLSLTERAGVYIPGAAREIEPVRDRHPSRLDPEYLFYSILFALKSLEPSAYYLPGEYHETVGQYLAFGERPGIFTPYPAALFRLGERGWVAVEGGDRDLLGGDPKFIEIPSRRAVYVSSYKGLFRYDGIGAPTPVPGASRNEIGRFPGVFELPALDRVIVAGQGLFELTPDGELDPIPLPRDLNGARFFRIVDMPSSSAAIVFSSHGVFALDRKLRLTRLRGDQKVDTGAVNISRYLDARGELFFGAPNGYFLVLDERIAGSGACGEERKPLPKQPVCLSKVSASDFRPVSPTSVFALSPTRDRVLMATGKGLFQIDRNGAFSRYEGTKAEKIGDMTTIPWSGALFVSGSSDGPFIIDRDGTVRMVDMGSVERNYTGRLAGMSLDRKLALFDPHFFSLLLVDDGAPRLIKVDAWISDVADVSWLDMPLLATNKGLRLLAPDGSVIRLPGNPGSRRPDGVANWTETSHRIDSIERFGFVLVDGDSLLDASNELRPLKGLPDGGFPHLSDIYLPESGDGYLATWKGLWRLTPEGAVYPARTERPIGEARTMVRPPWPGEWLVGASTGLHRIDGSGRVSQIYRGGANDIGAVNAIEPVPWLELVILETTLGFFTYSPDDGMRRVSQMGPHRRFYDVSVFPEVKEIFALEVSRARKGPAIRRIDFSGSGCRDS